MSGPYCSSKRSIRYCGRLSHLSHTRRTIFCLAAISPSEYEPWGIVTTSYPHATRALSDRSPPPRLSAAPLSRLSKLAPLRTPNAAAPHLLILKMAGLRSRHMTKHSLWYTLERAPLLWAQAQNNLAEASLAWGARENGTIRLDRAVAAYDEALKVYIRIPLLQWAKIVGNQGVALMLLAGRLGDLNRAQTAVHQISLACAALQVAYEMTAAAYYGARLEKAVALLNRLAHR